MSKPFRLATNAHAAQAAILFDKFHVIRYLRLGDRARSQPLYPSDRTALVDDPVKALVGRLDLGKYKAVIKGLTQFGDRQQGTDRNQAAVDWIETQLRTAGCTNTERFKYVSDPPPPPHEKSGKCLDIPNGATVDQVVVQQYTCNGGANQSWMMK
jgi:hypothetical protein